MTLFEDDSPGLPSAAHVVGSDLSELSVEELKGKIVDLQHEMKRIEQEISAKLAIKTAADSIFKD